MPRTTTTAYPYTRPPNYGSIALVAFVILEVAIVFILIADALLVCFNKTTITEYARRFPLVALLILNGLLLPQLAMIVHLYM